MYSEETRSEKATIILKSPCRGEGMGGAGRQKEGEAETERGFYNTEIVRE